MDWAMPEGRIARCAAAGEPATSTSCDCPCAVSMRIMACLLSGRRLGSANAKMLVFEAMATYCWPSTL